ncbi:hypothetical protein GCM10027271_30500 [Saccharopolyspora gloriosae]|uniref:Plastocyanin n=1 Tax=Saccharopolyspora gloriosae TaxID=455344 RepID=A0A840NFC8_9PSEU|nr:hypothetical protein [Saccharopolyspora gloriosae]MBB5071116.1 hypothetical protein [Saccharopolyspora gloriosae]
MPFHLPEDEFPGHRARRRSRTLIVLLSAFTMIVALCGGAVAAGAAAKPAEGDSPRKVTVTMVDYRLLMPSHLPPGRYTFRAVNRGIAPHALEVKGPGVENKRTITVKTGQSADLTVTLTRGTYDFWCPVGNHRHVGMELDVHVG